MWYVEECNDFGHIWYSHQIQYVVHTCEIAFGSVPILSNYGHFFIHVLLWYLGEEWVDLFLFVPCVADAWKISFGTRSDLSNYASIFLWFYVWCDILEKNGLILFIFGTVSYHNKDVKIFLGSMPKCSMYVHYIITLVCL